MERANTLLSRGWWFDPQRWQPEKLLSVHHFMASPKWRFPWFESASNKNPVTSGIGSSLHNQ
jgi:hypothetical protein